MKENNKEECADFSDCVKNNFSCKDCKKKHTMYSRLKNFLTKKPELKWWHIITGLLLLLALMGDSSCSDATATSQNFATTAFNKWRFPNITNFYEYQQIKQIYEARDNSSVILNAYLYSPMTGQLTCFGKVNGYGVPYSTEMSQPQGNSNQGSIPEPNGLYPSQNTNADWTRPIGPTGKSTDSLGKPNISFVEPEMIITNVDYPCTPMVGSGHD